MSSRPALIERLKSELLQCTLRVERPREIEIPVEVLQAVLKVVRALGNLKLTFVELRASSLGRCVTKLSKILGRKKPVADQGQAGQNALKECVAATKALLVSFRARVDQYTSLMERLGASEDDLDELTKAARRTRLLGPRGLRRSAQSARIHANRHFKEVSSLEQLCVDKLMQCAEHVFSIGDVPPRLVARFLKSCSPLQLLIMEQYNGREMRDYTAKLWPSLIHEAHPQLYETVKKELLECGLSVNEEENDEEEKEEEGREKTVAPTFFRDEWLRRALASEARSQRARESALRAAESLHAPTTRLIAVPARSASTAQSSNPGARRPPTKALLKQFGYKT